MSSEELAAGAVRALVTRHLARFTTLIEQCAVKATRMKRCSSASIEDVRGAAWVAVADPARWRHFAMGDATTEGAEWRRIGRWFRRVLNHVCEEAARAEDMVTIYHGTRRAAAEMRVGVRVYSSGTDEPAPGTMPAGAFEAAVHEALEIAADSTTPPASKIAAAKESEGLHLNPRVFDPVDKESAQLVEILAVMTGGQERVAEIWRIVSHSRKPGTNARRTCAEMRAQIELLDRRIAKEEPQCEE